MYNFLPFLLFFLLGVVVGSFLNVVIFRLERDEEFIKSRSKCLFCNHILAWKDLLPVLSFIFLKGKCRYCKSKISSQYPVVEIFTGLVFLFLAVTFFHNYNFSLNSFVNFSFFAYIFSALLIIFIFDLKHYIIPDKIIFPAIFFSVAFIFLEDFLSFGNLELSYVFNYLFSAVVSSGFFLFLVFLTKGKGMGGGDVKLGFLLGLLLGPSKTFLALFISFISGAIIGVLMIFAGKKKMKSMLPFGPFLIFGFLVSYFYGTQIINWYLEKFLF